MASAQKVRGGHRAVTTRNIVKLRTALSEEEINREEVQSLIEVLIKTKDLLDRLDEEVQVSLSEDEYINDLIEANERGLEITKWIKKGQNTLEAIERKNEESITRFFEDSKSKDSAVVKLPTIKLPIFSGDVLEWQAFWDVYKSSIHDRGDLAGSQKFAYLRGQLRAEALQLIEGFSTTDEDYIEAIDLLKNSYGKPYLIVQAHLHAIFDIQKPNCNSADLRKFRSIYESHLRSLRAMKIEVNNAGFVFAAYLLRKLPNKVRDNLNRASKYDKWDLDNFRTAIEREINLLQASEPEISPTSKLSAEIKPRAKEYPKKSTVSSFSVLNNNTTCKLCYKEHQFWECDIYKTPKECIKRAKILGLCFGCLSDSHFSYDCNHTRACRYCGGLHNTIFCIYSVPPQKEVNGDKGQVTEKDRTLSALTSIDSKSIDNGVALPTALLSVYMKNKVVKVRALFDQGSQKSFILRSLVSRYGFKVVDNIKLRIEGFNKTKSEQLYQLIRLKIDTSEGPKSIKALVVERLPNKVDVRGLPETAKKLIKANVKLADQLDSEMISDISIIVGADYYYDFVFGCDKVEEINLLTSNVGHMITGKLPSQSKNNNPISSTVTVLRMGVNDSLDERINILWNVEKIGINTVDNYYDVEVIKRFNSTIKYENGRYTVGLPWRQHKDNLPNNYRNARARLTSLIKSLRKNGYMKSYDKIINEYLNKGFIAETDFNPYDGYYLPHHGVLKDSSTTPLRIVFNCSAGNPSLNDHLHTGPLLINELGKVLLRFRLNKFASSSDIAKAYLMINLREDDQKFVKFLWPSNLDEVDNGLKVFKFKVVLFGATSSQFLLNATILYHLGKFEGKASSAIKRNIYVDNIFYTADSEDDLISFYCQASRIMSQGGFHLRSWISNSAKFRDNIPIEDMDNTLIPKILGLKWNINEDTLCINNVIFSSDFPSKRSVLGDCAKIFDPLGFLNPVTIRTRLFMQKLWEMKVSWDSPLSEELALEWKNILNDVSKFLSLKIQRPLDIGVIKGLHAFCDASLKAYGVVIYISGTESRLIISKAKVVPLKKQLTIPKLELSAIVIAARLLNYVRMAFEKELFFNQIYVWTDSKVALSWVVNERSSNLFVKNRVNEINCLIPDANFRYIPSLLNPADCLSRGITQDMLDEETWKDGPKWLTETEKWPSEQISLSENDGNICNVLTIHDAPNCFINIDNFSSIEKLIHVTVLVFRFLKILKHEDTNLINNMTDHNITLEEKDRICKFWIKEAQKEHFADEINFLLSGTRDKGKPPNLIGQLNLFLDVDGILRCKSRLIYSDLPYDTKYPVIFPKGHKLTELLILKIHNEVHHLGVSAVVNKFREQWWVPKLRQRVKSVLKGCVTCKRIQGRSFKPGPPPPLPPTRTSLDRPFYSVGVDYTGALLCRDGLNKKVVRKVYICLFTCALTRAVHFELIDDNSAETFICAFRKFIGRRSCPRYMYSDNALNFRSSSVFLNKIGNHPLVKQSLANHRCEWRFIPSRAPWMGGFWERLIGVLKRSLLKTLGHSLVTRQELEAVVIEIESNLNDRPLTYVYDDLNEPTALSPSQLIYGFQINAPSYSDKELKFQNPDLLMRHLGFRYRKTTKLKEQFWRRWQREYLTSLRGNRGPATPYNNKINIGDVVLIEDEGPHHKWKLGQVIRLHHGKDNLVRSAEVKTSKAHISRPIKMLYPLELQCLEDSPIATNKGIRKEALKALKRIKTQK